MKKGEENGSIHGLEEIKYKQREKKIEEIESRSEEFEG